jgi:hypothetical protein
MNSARKYGKLARKYVETRDDKKIVEELYELVGELEKLKKGAIVLETLARCAVQRFRFVLWPKYPRLLHHAIVSSQLFKFFLHFHIVSRRELPR